MTSHNTDNPSTDDGPEPQECQKCIGTMCFVGGEPLTCESCGSTHMVVRWTEDEINDVGVRAREFERVFGGKP